MKHPCKLRCRSLLNDDFKSLKYLTLNLRDLLWCRRSSSCHLINYKKIGHSFWDRGSKSYPCTTQTTKTHKDHNYEVSTLVHANNHKIALNTTHIYHATSLKDTSQTHTTHTYIPNLYTHIT